jgi:hypothetical protein
MVLTECTSVAVGPQSIRDPEALCFGQLSSFVAMQLSIAPRGSSRGRADADPGGVLCSAGRSGRLRETAENRARVPSRDSSRELGQGAPGFSCRADDGFRARGAELASLIGLLLLLVLNVVLLSRRAK